MITKLTCIECPMGCEITVQTDGNIVTVEGNGCPRGKAYAQNEVVCPMRVVTSTVKTSDGRLLPVKTDKPVKKSEIFNVMENISTVIVTAPIKINDIIVPNISDDANLIATDSLNARQ